MQVGLGSPLHGRLWLLRRWLRYPRPRGVCIHGGDEQQHHQKLSSKEQVDLGHGESGAGVSEHSLSPLSRFGTISPANDQQKQAWLTVQTPAELKQGRAWQRASLRSCAD
jgi:hypothetical protein